MYQLIYSSQSLSSPKDKALTFLFAFLIISISGFLLGWLAAPIGGLIAPLSEWKEVLF